MGDVLSLIEDIESKVDRAQAEKLASKLKKGDGFDLNDFLEQLRQMKNMGGMASLMGKLPGMGQIPDNVKSQMDDKVLMRMEAIINSMTMKERAKPEIIKGSRKRRIAAGCGMHSSFCFKRCTRRNPLRGESPSSATRMTPPNAWKDTNASIRYRWWYHDCACLLA